VLNRAAETRACLSLTKLCPKSGISCEWLALVKVENLAKLSDANLDRIMSKLLDLPDTVICASLYSCY
jgi:hypothetical protein